MANDTSAQRGFAEVNGARLYYEVAGSGRALVLVHAGICDERMWDDQFAAFAERYRVIRYDQRGFGQSTLPPGPYALQEDLAALLAQLGVSETAVVGVSMGGSASIDLTLTHPDLVKALVLVGSGLGGANAPGTPEEGALFAAVDAAIEAGDIETANAREVHIWVDGPHRDPAQVNPQMRERVAEMNIRGFREADAWKQTQSLPVEPPASTRLGEIKAPTLVIIGDQDVSEIQTTADILANGIPGARKVVMPNTAHVPNMEQPEQFNQIVLDFLASVGW